MIHLGRSLAWAWRQALAATSPRWLALLFLIQTSVAVVMLAILVPPFENPDEFNHFNRADQVASLGLIATRYAGGQTSGGKVDAGINQIDAMIGTIRFHPERKVTRAMMLQANAIRWGHRAWITFANTSIYSPFLYLAAVPGVWAGKLLGLTITHTLMLSRAVNGLACVVAASAAIGCAEAAAPFLFIVLSLPMCVFLFACVSQDGPMLVLAANAVTLLTFLQKETIAAIKFYMTALWICLALVGIGRPAYAPFCVLPLLLSRVAWRDRIRAAGAALAGIVAWSAIAAHWSLVNAVAYRGVDPRAQLVLLFQHPAKLWTLAVSIVTGAQGMEGASFYREMVGILGWQDVFLPDFFYSLAGCALLGSILVLLARDEATLSWLARSVVFLAGAGAVVLVFLLEYLSWTPVGLPIVQGVQGRYFLPVLLFLPAMLPAFGKAGLAKICAPVRVVLLMFPMISIPITIASVVVRYYL